MGSEIISFVNEKLYASAMLLLSSIAVQLNVTHSISYVLAFLDREIPSFCATPGFLHFHLIKVTTCN